MTGLRGLGKRLPALLAILPATSLMAASPKVCDDIGRGSGVALDKQDLALWALDEGHVPRRLERAAAAARDGFPALAGLTVQQFILTLGPALCDKVTCAKGDDQLLIDAVTAFRGVLRDTAMVGGPGAISTERFFREPTAKLSCPRVEAQIATAAATAAGSQLGVPTQTTSGGKPYSTWGPEKFDPNLFRIRGTSEDLIYARGESGYASVAKAKIGYSDDRVEKTRSTDLVVAFGYPLDIWRGGNAELTHYTRASVIPFAAVNVGRSRKDGEGAKFSGRQAEFGAAIQILRSDLVRTYTHVDSYHALFAKYAVNYDDGSAVVSANALFRPYLARGLNSLTALGRSKIAGSFTFNLRLNNGHFTRAGTRKPEDARDFSRFGGEVGFALSSAPDFPLPFDATVSETYMARLAGRPGDLKLFKAELGIYSSDDKTIGVNLSYTRGRDEDFDDYARAFSVGLGFKF